MASPDDVIFWPKSEPNNVRIDPELKAKIDKAAAAEHRSPRSLIENILTDYFK